MTRELCRTWAGLLNSLLGRSAQVSHSFKGCAQFDRVWESVWTTGNRSEASIPTLGYTLHSACTWVHLLKYLGQVVGALPLWILLFRALK